jgi:hypothetical protein
MAKLRYDYYEKIRKAVSGTIHRQQPVTLLQLTSHLTGRYGFQAIKNELKRLTTENLVSRQRASKCKGLVGGGTGFFYSVPTSGDHL